ncbi:MCE family protein [Nocardia sp. CDC159]|uniref:MCE family protein n=1 Tax=Nocardia pulmonis TaxID=2951408 RepID=A0A9X2EB79_9NOCA|nr:MULTISPECIES: MCE family protein [Nocardia]MCM6777020.1 MCE family protein [Nocardia pulmonis]MCM6789444.1 MCE family protein [Nocardia sp. CDC159]
MTGLLAGARLSVRARRAAVALAASVGVLAASGCGLTVEKLPLPKPGVTGDTYTVHAVFANALNLPDQAKVKIGGSDVGVVSHISTKNFQAVVDLTIRKDIELPAGSTAELRQATPLGDVFVAVSKPKSEPGTQLLKNGDTIGIEKTSAGATVEELLLSISMLFNGGGVAALGKLTSELDSVVGGRPDQLANLIRQMTSVTTTLHANSERIDSTLNGFGALANTIEARHNELGRVADTLPGMIGTIAENNQQIGELLTKVSTTSAALGDYSETTGTQLADLLDNVHKLMDALARTQNDLGPLLDAFHEIRPKIDSTFKGNSLANALVLTSLNTSLLTDPPQGKFFDLRDLHDMQGSLIQVLQIVYSRVTGGHR